MALDRRVVGTQLDLFRIMEFRLADGDVLRQIDQHRAGATGAGDVESFLDGFGQVLDVPDQEVVLDARPGNADRVDFLKRVVADQRRGHLPGEHHQWDGIHVGVGDAGNGVGDAGAGGDQHHAGFAAGAGVTFGGVDGGLFVTDQHMLDMVLGVQGVIDVQHGAARITEHAFDAFFLQATDENFSTRDEFHNRSLLMANRG